MWIATAHAQDATVTATAPPEPSAIASMLPLFLVFFILYFLLIRPQQKKIKQHQDMVASLHRGDKVVTGGGIIGTIVKLEGDDIAHVEIAQGVKVKVARQTISNVMSRTGMTEGKGDGKEDKTAKTANDN